jgi:hypothetical protein
MKAVSSEARRLPVERCQSALPAGRGFYIANAGYGGANNVPEAFLRHGGLRISQRRFYTNQLTGLVAVVAEVASFKDTADARRGFPVLSHSLGELFPHMALAPASAPRFGQESTARAIRIVHARWASTAKSWRRGSAGT